MSLHFPTCKETTALVTESMHTRLGWRRRSGMWLHLLVCANCVEFMRHMHLLRKWLRNEEIGPDLKPDARERIERCLHEEIRQFRLNGKEGQRPPGHDHPL
jgi:hypothetical protein